MPTELSSGLNLIRRLKFKRKVAENNIKCYSFQKNTKYIEKGSIKVRKKIPLILILIAVLGLNGCLVNEIPLSNSEIDAVAQYCADVLLRHDSNYNSSFLEATALTPTPTNTPKPTPTNTPTPTPRPTVPPRDPNATLPPTSTPTNTPTPTPFPANTAETWRQLAKVIGAEDFSVIFAGASEPEDTFSISDSFVTLSKIPGYDYIAAKFVIENKNSVVKYLKTCDMELKGLIMVNGIYFDYEVTSLLLNDLFYIGIDETDYPGEKVAPGGRYNEPNGAVVVFKVPEDIEIETAGMLITNKYGDNVIIKIQ